MRSGRCMPQSVISADMHLSALLQVISAEDALQAYMPSIAGLANITTDSFKVAMTEAQIREVMKAANRVTGLEGVKSSFGLPEHTHALLQDTQLHKRLQVSRASSTLGTLCLYRK